MEDEKILSRIEKCEEALEKLLERAAERRHIKNLIRRGVMPRYTFARDPRDEDGNELEVRKVRGRERYTWRQVSTLDLITNEGEK